MTNNPLRLLGKKVIITAAASGMGRAGCELFAQHGARIAAVDRDEAALTSMVHAIAAAGGVARGFIADLTDLKASAGVVRDAHQWLEGLDVLWSHAGMAGIPDVEDIDLDRYRETTDLNLNSAVVVAGEAVRVMRRQSSGSIVFTSSTSGLVGSLFSPVYSALKHGVIGLTKGLAVRYAADNIRVNALCPGPVATPMLYNDFMKVDARFSKAENESRLVAAVPMRRLGQPIEIAHAALWLASDDASFVTGATLSVDGGFTAQ